MIPVVWLNRHNDSGNLARGFWDQGLLEGLFDQSVWRPVNGFTFSHHGSVDGLDGAVVVLAARWHATEEDVAWVREQLDRLQWALVILTGDEEAAFPWREIRSERRKFWIQTPFPDHHADADRLIGDYWPPATPGILRGLGPPVKRNRDWYFAGQINNAQRTACLEAAQSLANNPRYSGAVLPTEGFAQGISHAEYLADLSDSRTVLAPSGSYTPDTFRLFEALEAGAVPIADDAAPNTGPVDYWHFLFGEAPPFPVLSDWADVSESIDKALRNWPHTANKVFAWWQGYKRRVAYWLRDDLASLTGETGSIALADKVTVLIPTSPIPAHPSTDTIRETVASVTERLPGAELIVMIDGVRSEQADRRKAYAEYVQELLWLTNHEWPNALPLLFTSHHHQAAMTRRALEHVRTPWVLFVEHDAPLVGEIPIEQLLKVEEANVIRLYHEVEIHPDHRHLMLDQVPQDHGGIPLMRTAQWSQRPHLARTTFYREIINRYFGSAARTMIEDAMHSVLEHYWREYGPSGWDLFRVFIYTPPGDIKRSMHLDARGEDPKYDMHYAYDSEEVPWGAPRPS